MDRTRAPRLSSPTDDEPSGRAPPPPGGGEAASLTIGQAARAACVHVETIRYYQRRGLLPLPPRPWGGQRRYDAAFVERVRFIRRAQRIGFSLEEIRGLLEIGEGSCEEVRARAERKRAELEHRIEELIALRGHLERLIASCPPGGLAEAPCPIVQSLAAGREPPPRPRPPR